MATLIRTVVQRAASSSPWHTIDMLEPRLLMTTLYWDPNGAAGLGGTGTWDTNATNWTTNPNGSDTRQAWDSNADAVFSGTAGSVTMGAGISAGSITFNTSGYGISGSSLTLNGAATITANSDVTFGCVITGSSGLTTAGSGTITLTGANTYSGTTTIAAGTLQVGNGGLTGTLGTGSVSNSGTLKISRLSNFIFANAVSGTGTLVKLGSGTTILTGANTYSGTTTISAGTLQIGNGSTAGTLGTGSVSNSGTLKINRTDTVTLANDISGSGILYQMGSGTTILKGNNTNNGTTTIAAGILQLGDGGTVGTLGSGTVSNSGVLKFNRSDTFTFANTVSGSGALSQIGSGTIVLTGNNTNNGTTTIAAGTLQLGNGGTVGTLGSGTVSNSGVLKFNRSDTFTFANTVSGSGSLYQMGSGTTILKGNNTNNGTTTITAGTLQLGDGGTVGTLGSGTVSNSSTLKINHSDTVTLANVISDSGTLVQMGSGTTILTGANTYSGTTTISAGTLRIGNGSTVGKLGTGNVSISGTLKINHSDTVTLANIISGSGALVQMGSGTTMLTGANTFNGNTTISAGSLQLGDGSSQSGTVNGNIYNYATLVFANPNNLTFGGSIDGYGSLIKSGAGTLTLTGSTIDTYAITISAGELDIAGSMQIFDDSSVVGGATLNVIAGGALTNNYRLQINGGTLTVSDGSILNNGELDFVSVAPSASLMSAITNRGIICIDQDVDLANLSLQSGTYAIGGQATATITNSLLIAGYTLEIRSGTTLSLVNGQTITVGNEGILDFISSNVSADLLNAIVNQGTIIFDQDVDLKGLTLASGTYQFNVDVHNSGDMTYDGASLEAVGGRLINNGTITWQSNNLYYLCAVDNQSGSIKIVNNMDFTGVVLPAGAYLVGPDINVTVDDASLSEGAFFTTNSGTLHWQSSNLNPLSQLDNQGTVIFEQNVDLTGLTLSGGYFQYNAEARNTGTLTVDTTWISGTGYFVNDGTIYGDITFDGASANWGTVNGNATFYGSSLNWGTVNGNAYFAGTSINYWGYDWINDIWRTGTINGWAWFSETSSNLGDIYGDTTFHDSSFNNGTITGDVSFYESSYHWGTIDGNAFFYDSSFNDGSITGDATFNYASEGTLIIGQGQKWFGDVGGSIIGRDGYEIYTWFFDGGAFKGGTIKGDAKFIEGFDGTLTFTGDEYWCGEVTGTITGGDDEMITQWEFYGNSTNDGITHGDAVFNDSSCNLYYSTIVGTATFNGSSVNEGTIIGFVQFYDSSTNYGTITGFVCFNDNSTNQGEVDNSDDLEGWTLTVGTYKFDTDIPNSGDLTITDATLVSNGGHILNHGTIHWQNSNLLGLSVIDNSHGGTIIFDGDVDLAGQTLTGGTYQFDGTLYSTGNSSFTISSNSSVAIFDSTIANINLINEGFLCGHFTLDGGSLLNTGTLQIDGPVTLTNGGHILNTGTLHWQNNDFSGLDVIDNQGGTIIFERDVDLAGMTLSSGTYQFDVDVHNYGEMTYAGATLISNGGHLVNYSVLHWQSDDLSLLGLVDNWGRLILESGGTFTSNYTIAAGATLDCPVGIAVDGGTLSGEGNVLGSVTFINGSSNYVAITGDVNFDNHSANYGGITGNVGFSNHSNNYGTISGDGDCVPDVWCYPTSPSWVGFDNYSHNYSQVIGFVQFANNSNNQGSIIGMASFDGSSSNQNGVTLVLRSLGDLTCSSGTYIIYGNPVTAGNITVTGGTLSVSCGVQLESSSIEVRSGGTFTLNSATLYCNSTLSIVGGNLNVVGGAIYNYGYLVVSQGELNLTNANINNYFGSMEVSGGAVFLSGSSLNNCFGGNVTVSSGTLTLSEDSWLINYYSTVTVSGGAVYFVNDAILMNSGTLTIMDGSLNLNDSSLINYWDANSNFQGGAVEIRGGVLTLSNNAIFDNSGGGTLQLSAGKLTLATSVPSWVSLGLIWNSGTVEVTTNGILNLTQDMTVRANCMLELAGGDLAITTGRHLIIASGGTLAFNGSALSQALLDAITNQGLLRFDQDINLSGLTFTSGTYHISAGVHATNNTGTFTLLDGVCLENSGTWSCNGALLLGSGAEIRNNGILHWQNSDLSLLTQIKNNNRLEVDFSGLLTLDFSSGDPLYSGVTGLNGVASSNALHLVGPSSGPALVGTYVPSAMPGEGTLLINGHTLQLTNVGSFDLQNVQLNYLPIFQINGSPTEHEISFTYGVSPFIPGQQLELEIAGPTDLNYHRVTSFQPLTTSGTHSYTLTGLSPSSHYSLRLRAVHDGIVSYAYASGDTSPSAATLQSPVNLVPGTTHTPGQTALNFQWDPSSDANASAGFTVTVRAFSSASPLSLFNLNHPAQTFVFTPADFTADHQYVVFASLPLYCDQIALQISDSAGGRSAWMPLQLQGRAVPATTPTIALAVSHEADTVTFSVDTPSTATLYGITSANQIRLLGSFGGASSLPLTQAAIPSDVQRVIVFDGSAYSQSLILPGVTLEASTTTTNLTVTQSLVGGQPQVHLLWDNVLNSENGYLVQRENLSASAPSWVNLSSIGVPFTVGADQSCFTDTTLSASDVYSYRILAVNADGTAVISNTVLVWFAPLVSALGVYSPNATVGSAISVSATATPENNTDHSLTYIWSFTQPSGSTLPVSISTPTPTLSFTPDVAGDWTVHLTVTDTTLSLTTVIDSRVLHITSAPALVIQGPAVVTEGQMVQYTATGSGANTAIWNVTKNGTPVTGLTGVGSQFTFTPSDSGAYVITAVTTSPSRTNSCNLTVSYIPPTVTISGSPIGLSGKSLVFGSQFSELPAVGDTITYQWQLLNADGSSYSAPVVGGATFTAPGNLAPNQYQLQLTVTDMHNGLSAPISAKFSFVILSTQVSSNFDWGVMPLLSSYLVSSDRPLTNAIVQQADGKLVVGGLGIIDQRSSAFIARFNPDLTPDTSFGPNHTGYIYVDMQEKILPNGNSRVFDLAINPINQNIVAVGIATDIYGNPMLSVSQYVASDTVTSQGQMVTAGMFDPAFNHGHPKTLDGPNTSSAGWEVLVLPDGSILVGGMEQTTGSEVAVQTINEFYGTGYDIVSVDDFFLVKLNPDGQLDTRFNGTGIAEEPGLTQLPAYMPYTWQPGEPQQPTWKCITATPTSIQSLSILPNGQILAGGYARRFAMDGGGGRLGEGIDTGFALVRYNIDGSVDRTFGTNGQTFTSSEVFNQTADGSAYLSAMIVQANGKILTAGIADSREAMLAHDEAHLVLAQYDANGHLDTTYGSGGMTKTNFIVQRGLAGVYIDGWQEIGLHFWPENGDFVFQPDGKLVVSANVLSTSPHVTWRIARFNTDGTLDNGFGSANNGQMDVPVPPFASGEDWWLVSGNRPTAMLLTTDGVVGVGSLFTYDTGIPLVVRYRLAAEPSANNLTMSTSLDGFVTLAWTNTGFGQDGFEIRRATTPSGLDLPSAFLATVGPTQMNYVDTMATTDTTYYYRVVPFTTATTGQQQFGTPTNDAYVHTLPCTTSFISQETLEVPLDGSPVTTSGILQTGQTYLLVASGDFLPTGEDGFVADSAYWYSSEKSLRMGIQSLSCDTSNYIATATTTSPHDYKVGDKVYIGGVEQWEYNGVFTVTAISTNSFSYKALPGTPETGTGLALWAQWIDYSKDSNSFYEQKYVLPLTSLSCTGTTATATLASAHGYHVGDQAYIKGATQEQYNGLITITAVTSTSFSYTVPNGTPATATSAGITTRKLSYLTNLSCSGTTATATTVSAHGYSVGDLVRIGGADQGEYDGVFTITAVTTLSFSYTVPVGIPPVATGAALTAQKLSGLAITSLNCSNTTATATTASAHGYMVGDQVYVGDVEQEQYEGLVTITAVTSTSFSYTVPNNTPSAGTPPIFTVQKSNALRYGIGFNNTGTAEENQVIDWGSSDPVNHTYTYAYVGQGTPLTFRLHDTDSHYAYNSASSRQLQVKVYTVTGTATNSPVRQIISPLTSEDSSTPVISTNTPVTIVSANPDGSAVPWTLWLVSSSGAKMQLASSDHSVGQLPVNAAPVATINPALYPNGLYTLQLTSSANDPDAPVVDSRQVVISTVVKTGNFTLPVTDATIITTIGSITLSRSYDSFRTDQAGDFGPGWTLNLLDTQLYTTAQTDTYDPMQTTPVLRAGDLVCLSVPEDGQHVFEFSPTSLSSGSPTSVEYAPCFVALDGSGATLTLACDTDEEYNITLAYDEHSNEYVSNYGQGFFQRRIGFNPARPEFHRQYQLTTKDGTSYLINAATGRIQSVTDTNGNTINYTTNGDGSITATSSTNQTLLTIQTNDDHQITSIQVPGQNPIIYTYNPTGDLQSVQNQTGDKAFYAYQAPNYPHYLTGITSAQGQAVLQAQYDPTTGLLQSLINASGQTFPVAVVNLGINQAVQTLTDALGNITQNVFDVRYGTLQRKIQTETDQNGNVTGYLVTVMKYSYVIDDLGTMSALRPSGIHLLQSIQQYPSFLIAGPDLDGLRYSTQPATDMWTTQTIYNTSNNPQDPASGQVIQVSERQKSDGTLKVTDYGNFKLISAALQIAKPQRVIVTIQTPDINAPTGYLSHVQNATYAKYDDNGNMIYSVTAMAPDPSYPGCFTGEGTHYVYTSGGGVPAGRVDRTYKIRALIDPNSTSPDGPISQITQLGEPESQNFYYGVGEVTIPDYQVGIPGALYGAPKYSLDAAGQKTWYAFDSNGHTLLSYTYKQWTDATGTLVSGWVGTTTVYDAKGRQTDQYQATYFDGGNDQVLQTKVGGPAGVDVDEPIYSSPLRIQHDTYNASGQKIESINQYGGITSYTYDALGNLIRTLNPNGTETRTVYDALGRAIWTTHTFVRVNDDLADPANSALLTHTVYNQLGQVIRTEEYQAGAIIITSSKTGSISVWESQVTLNTLTPYSSTQTFYNPQGQAIETINPSGLRTGTIYYPNGQVYYSGPLTATAPDGGHLQTNSGITSADFQLSDFAYYTTNNYAQYDSTLNLFYDSVTDANGHTTVTYKDLQGRTVRTVYADGSFTETLYSLGDQVVSQSQEGEAIATPFSYNGGQEVVQIDQRQAGDPLVLTYYLYDASGKLTDVWQPAVLDADPASITVGQLIHPHWHYGYDVAGNETSQTDPKNHTTTFGYDQNGHKVRQILPEGEKQTWTYSIYGMQVSHKVYSATDHATALQTTLVVYDTSAAHGGRRLVENRYASDVLLTTSVTPDERTIYTYDDNISLPTAERTNLGRIVEVDDLVKIGSTLQLSAFAHNTYDPVTSQVTSLTTAQGTINYVYDPATGLLVETWTGTTHTTPANDILYGYDAFGRLVSVSQLVLNGQTPTPVANSTRYDATGHALATTMPTTLYGYDHIGNLQTDLQPNGVQTTYTYNKLNQLTDELIENVLTSKRLFAEYIEWQHNGQKHNVTDTRYQADGSTELSQTQTTWHYDTLNRLIEEQLVVLLGSGSEVPAAYDNTFFYDLANNRIREDINGGDQVPSGLSIVYTYNANDQLATENQTQYGNITFYTDSYTYDAQGSLQTETRTGVGAKVALYAYDLRNHMTRATINGQATTYGYDTNGTLASKVDPAGTPTYYLNDPYNPTSYTKSIQESTTSGGAPTRSSVLGLKVEAQADASHGTFYLLLDGHGSTRALTNQTGTSIAGQNFDYDGFGTTLTFTPVNAYTTWLFGGDGFFEPSTGWTYQLARWRNSFWFTQSDTYTGNNSDPLSLHKYLYVQANPNKGYDPSGHILCYLGMLMGTAGGLLVDAGLYMQDAGQAAFAQGVTGFVYSATLYYGASLGIAIESAMGNSPDPSLYTMQQAGYYGMWFFGAYATAGLGLQFMGMVMASAGAMMQALAPNSCFLAGTLVLLSDGQTKAIDQIHVGQRVATDGGVANSADGQTAATDPNATQVDPATWRLVTIKAGDWEVQTLEPISWIVANDVSAGHWLRLTDVVDLAEMGTPTNLIGIVESVDACPNIEAGPGRVVLTTVSHLNDFVFNLTLSDNQGKTDTLGVTGFHRFYTEDRGWVIASELQQGEVVRGDHGDVVVLSILRDPGLYRVYNMTVEDDHVFYVGNVTALVHNVWCDGKHHSWPEYLTGPQKQKLWDLSGEDHQEIHELITDKLEDAFVGEGAPAGKGAAEWDAFLNDSKHPERMAKMFGALNDAYDEFFGPGNW